MSQGIPHTAARRAFLRFITGLAFAGLAGGIAMCLVQGQGAKSLKFSAAAQAYYTQAQAGTLTMESAIYLRMAARDAAIQALAYQPSDAETWYLLSHIMLQNNAHEAALEARTMAQNLGVKPEESAAGFAAAFDTQPVEKR